MAAMEAAKPLRLRCSVQNYDWGRSGEESTVARLFARNSAAEIEPETPYAEFWMGTHPSGPSTVVSGEAEPEPPATLKSWIAENRGALGDEVVERWGADLPFLFKVLSVEKALSIQAHPDKELAKVLHEAYPSLYKDSNHKPEMAVALTEFRALCGFISVEELRDVISTVPEIAELIGNENAIKVMDIKEQDGNEKVKALLQSIFTKLMTATKEEVSEAVSSLKRRLNMEQKDRLLTEKEELALLLEKQYPVDVGVISAFFFNYVKLNPGEALYLGANEPHAYISGECIECMATSDNVVRAGLTPKYRDVRTLCSMLTYKQGFPEILRGVPMNPYVLRYTPPFEEFEVDGCLLPPGESTSFPAVRGPSILIAVAGEGTLRFGPAADEYAVKDGCVFFVPANAEIILSSNNAGSLHMYRAGINSMFFI